MPAPDTTIDPSHSFDDSAAYERFVGSWGRAAGAAFLEWIEPPSHARWLDVGCGTGLFTELILDAASPSEVTGVDQAAAQIAYARSKPALRRADFRVSDAQALPFANGAFDLVVSALTINFIPDRRRAVSEMRRVARADGTVAGYVWDFTAERSPSGPFRLAMGELVAIPPLPGTEDSTLKRLGRLFENAELGSVATTSFDVTVSFPDFDAFWLAQTPSYSPVTTILASMTSAKRAGIREAVRDRVAAQADGSIVYPARANAIKARVPG